MAETKPTKIPRWNDDLTNQSEPAEAKKDAGWVLNDEPPSSFLNWLQHFTGQWFKWIDERSADGVGAEDFDIKAVDSPAGTDQTGGTLGLEGGASTGDGGSKIEFRVARAGQGTGSTVRSPATEMTLDDDGILKSGQIEATSTDTDANAITGAGDGDGAGVYGVGGATGPGVSGVGGSGSGDPGVVGTGDGAGAGVEGTGGPTNGAGLSGIGTGAGPGVTGTGGSSNGSGVKGTGGATNGDGVEGIGTGTGHGVTGTGGSGGTGAGVRGIGGTDFYGVWGTGTGAGYGVYGQGSAAGSVGVYGYGTGIGPGVQAVASGTGYGLNCQADPTTPSRSSLRVTPQDTDPSNAGAGDVYFNNLTGRQKNHDGNVWAKVGSQVFATTADSSSVTDTTAETAFNQSFQIPANSLEDGGSIRIRCCGDLSITGTPSLSMRVKIAGQTISSLANTLVASGDWAFDVEVSVRSIGATGNLRIVGFNAFTPANGGMILDHSIAIVDTTAAMNVAVTAQWGTQSASNTTKMTLFVIRMN